METALTLRTGNELTLERRLELTPSMPVILFQGKNSGASTIAMESAFGYKKHTRTKKVLHIILDENADSYLNINDADERNLVPVLSGDMSIQHAITKFEAYDRGTTLDLLNKVDVLPCSRSGLKRAILQDEQAARNTLVNLINSESYDLVTIDLGSPDSEITDFFTKTANFSLIISGNRPENLTHTRSYLKDHTMHVIASITQYALRENSPEEYKSAICLFLDQYMRANHKTSFSAFLDKIENLRTRKGFVTDSSLEQIFTDRDIAKLYKSPYLVDQRYLDMLITTVTKTALENGMDGKDILEALKELGFSAQYIAEKTEKVFTEHSRKFVERKGSVNIMAEKQAKKVTRQHTIHKEVHETFAPEITKNLLADLSGEYGGRNVAGYLASKFSAITGSPQLAQILIGPALQESQQNIKTPAPDQTAILDPKQIDAVIEAVCIREGHFDWKYCRNPISTAWIRQSIDSSSALRQVYEAIAKPTLLLQNTVTKDTNETDHTEELKEYAKRECGIKAGALSKKPKPYNPILRPAAVSGTMHLISTVDNYYAHAKDEIIKELGWLGDAYKEIEPSGLGKLFSTIKGMLSSENNEIITLGTYMAKIAEAAKRIPKPETSTQLVMMPAYAGSGSR